MKKKPGLSKGGVYLHGKNLQLNRFKKSTSKLKIKIRERGEEIKMPVA